MTDKQKAKLEAIAVQVAQENYEEADNMVLDYAREELGLDTEEGWTEGRAAEAEAREDARD